MTFIHFVYSLPTNSQHPRPNKNTVTSLLISWCNVMLIFIMILTSPDGILAIGLRFLWMIRCTACTIRNPFLNHRHTTVTSGCFWQPKHERPCVLSQPYVKVLYCLKQETSSKQLSLFFKNLIKVSYFFQSSR